MTLLTFRDAIKRKSPRWLRKGIAEKVLYSIALQLDGLTDAVTAGVKMRFPGLYSNESLGIIGRERRIRRGRTDLDANYASRLLRWWDDHKNRGGPYAMLRQLYHYWAPNNFQIDLVYYSGLRFQMAVDGTITRDKIVWAPDANAAKWARWWLFFHWPDPVSDNGLWGSDGLNWGDSGKLWGMDLTRQQVDELRLIPTEWNAAHPIGHVVLLSGGGRLWGYPPDVIWNVPSGQVWGGGSVVTIPIP